MLRMMVVGVGICLLAAPASGQSGADRIRRHNGVDSGKITATTPLGVTISKGGVETTVPAEEIQSVSFAGEPDELAAARTAVQTGRAAEALEALGKIGAASGQRDEVAAEIDFFTTLAKARLALAGKGSLDAATTDVRSFMSRRGKSYHIPEAIELLGDLLLAAGQHGAARTEYAKLAKAKSAYYGLQSALLVGRAWQAEGDAAKAAAEFDKVLNSTERGTLIEPLRLAATLERAVSQAAAGKVDESAKAIGDIIAQADPENAELLARAYNALGDCYLKSGDQRAALFAFLHVDLLYSSEEEAHARALHELVGLWKAVGRENRSRESAQKLAEKYPNSQWARQ